MKGTVLFFGMLFAFAALFGVGCASSPDDPARSQNDAWWDGSQARVRELHGTVEYSRDGAAWVDAFEGQPIREGDRLRTGPGSEARINLGKERGGWVQVRPGSVLVFEQLEPATENSEVGVILNLPQGRVTGDTARTAQGKKILVKTPNGMHEITADGE